MQKGHKVQTETHSTNWRQVCAEEGSGEIRWKAPTPEREDAIQRKEGSKALVKPEGSTYARARSTHSVQYGGKHFERRVVQKWWPLV